MCPSKDKGFEIDLQLTEIDGGVFLLPFPVLDYSGFPSSEIKRKEGIGDVAKKIETSAITSVGTEQFYEVEVEPATSKHIIPSEDAPVDGYEPTLIIEKPQGQPLSLDAPADKDWKITVRRPEESLLVPNKRLSRTLLLVLLLFLAFGICYWLKVEPIRGKTDSVLKELILMIKSKTATTTTTANSPPKDESKPQESEFKKNLRKHLKRILGE